MNITVSNGVLISLWASLFVSLGLPIVYFLALHKKLKLLTILIGVAAYLVLGYFAEGLLFGAIGEIKSPLLYTVAAVLITGMVEGWGHKFALTLTNKRFTGKYVALSYGLGFSLINVLVLGSTQSVTALSMALSLNSEGAEAILASVDATQYDAMLAQLTRLSEAGALTYLLSALEIACFFVLSLAIPVIVSYSLRDENGYKYLAIGIVARAVAAAPGALYTAGGTDDYLLMECIYFALTAIIGVYTFILFSRREEKNPIPAAPHVNPRDWR